MIISYPYWKKTANGKINLYSGMRTAKSMKNKENWKKAHLLCGKYCVRVGSILIFFVTLMRYIQILPMEWNSLLISYICIISFILLTIFVNSKLD